MTDVEIDYSNKLEELVSELFNSEKFLLSKAEREGVMTHLGMEDFILKWRKIIKTLDSSLEKKGEAIELAFTEEIPYKSAFLFRLLSNKVNDEIEVRALLKTALSILDGQKLDEKDLKTKFSIFNKLFEIVWIKDGDFILAQDILKQQEKILDELNWDMPPVFMGPYVFNTLELYRRLEAQDFEGKVEKILKEVLDGKIVIPATKRIFFLIEATKFLSREKRHFFLGKLLGVYESFVQGTTSSESMFYDFFDSLSEKELETQKLQYIPIAEREFLTSFSGGDKEGEDYRDLKENIFKSWKGKDPIGTKFNQAYEASVLEVEGFDLENQETILQSVKIFKKLGIDFKVPEIEIRRILRFFGDIKLDEKKDILLENWKKREDQWGRKAIEVFLTNLNSSIVRQTNDIQERSRNVISPEGLNHKEEIDFHRIPNIPDYINDIAEAIVKIYNPTNNEVLRAFKNALKQYFDKYETAKATKIDKAGAELTSPDDFLQEIKDIFGLEGIEILSGEEINNNELAKKALEMNRKEREEYVLNRNSKVRPLREEIFIPLDGKEGGRVLVIKNRNKKELSKEDLGLIITALGGKLEEITKEKRRELLIPKKFQTKIVRDEKMTGEIFHSIQELYILGLGLEMPKRPEEGEDGKIWGLVYTEDGDLVGAGCISPATTSSSPFIYAGYPADKDQIEKVLESKLEECAVTGGLAIYPYFKRQVFPLLLKICGEITKKEGYQNNLMVVHKAVIQILEQLIRSEDIKKIPVLLTKDSEEIKRRLKEVYGWDARFVAECVRIYANENSASIMINLERLSDIQTNTSK